MIMFLEEPLERRTAAYSILRMCSNDNVAILARVLRRHDHIIPITDGIVDHRLSTYDQCKNIRSLKALIHLKERRSIGKNVEWHSCRDCPPDRNAWWLGELHATAYAGESNDASFFFEHGQVMVDMTCARFSHRTTDFAIGGWHALGGDMLHNKRIYSVLQIALGCLSHELFPTLPETQGYFASAAFRTPFQRKHTIRTVRRQANLSRFVRFFLEEVKKDRCQSNIPLL